jgi:hypothetical protein
MRRLFDAFENDSHPLRGTCFYDSASKEHFCMNRLLTPPNLVRIGKLHPAPARLLEPMNPRQRLLTVTNSSRPGAAALHSDLILG